MMQGRITLERVFHEVELSATFLQPCSAVAWAGAIQDDQTFVVNGETADGLLKVKVRNPMAPARFWAMDDRLEWVQLQYRQKGDVHWMTAKDDELEVADFTALELDKTDISIVCRGRKVMLSLANTMTTAAVAGKRASVQISGVLDQANNEMISDVSWEFDYNSGLAAAAQAMNQGVVIRQMNTDVDWSFEYADKSGAAFASLQAQLTADLATQLLTDASRIAIKSLHAD